MLFTICEAMKNEKVIQQIKAQVLFMVHFDAESRPKHSNIHQHTNTLSFEECYVSKGFEKVSVC